MTSHIYGSVGLLSTVLLLVLVVTYLADRGADALSCMPCYNRQGEYVGPACDPMPTEEDDYNDCEPAYRPCGCCPECSGGVGDDCNGMTVRCKSGLVCTNEDGETRPEVEWWEYQFFGHCRQPEML